MHYSGILQDDKSSSYFFWGVLASILVHLSLVIFLSLSVPRPGDMLPGPAIMVNMVELPKLEDPARKDSAALQAPQIVSATGQKESEPNPEAKYLSDRNTTTKHEQVNRGAGEDAAPVIGKGVLQQAPKTEPEQARKIAPQNPAAAGQSRLTQQPTEKSTALTHSAPAPTSQKLDLSTSGMGEELSSEKTEDAGQRIAKALSGGLNNEALGGTGISQPFSRPYGSGARFLGKPGSLDYLPSLPDGDITLLNTKANIFAVFVRRVALQVFSQLRTSGWEFLHARDIAAVRDDCTVNAILSPKGNLLKVTLADSSGSPRFDEVLFESVKMAAKDPNPPAAAALSDGNIHFIFKAKSWVSFAAGQGPQSERRWLVLATGLE